MSALHIDTQMACPSLVDDLKNLGSLDGSVAAPAAMVAAAQHSGPDIRFCHHPVNDIVLVSPSLCRLSVRVDGEVDRIFRLCPNTVVLLRHGHTYAVRYTNCDRLLALAVSPTWLKHISERCDVAQLAKNVTTVETALHPDIPPLVAAIGRGLNLAIRPQGQFLKLNVELLLSHYFLVRGCRGRAPLSSVGLSSEGMQRVLEKIEVSLDGRILVSELVQMAGMTPSQFSRTFKASLGVSPQCYILERRAQACQNLLETSDLPLAEVAYEVGFSSQAHMTATFTKKFGITPGEFRKSLVTLKHA